MAWDRRKSVGWFAGLLVLGGLLVWAWFDGGLRAVTPLTAPASLPGGQQ